MRRSTRTPWGVIWAAAWVAFALVYAMLTYAQSLGAMSFALSLRVALLSSSLPAVMSIGVWRLSGGYTRRRTSRLTSVAAHAAAGLLFAGLWAGWSFGIARMGRGPKMGTSALVHAALPWQAVTGLLVYGVVLACSYSVRALVHARNMELAAEHAERLRLQAHLASLRAHIDPHFLFNTLHTVSALLDDDVEGARSALENLSDVFRYALRLDRSGDEVVSLEEEWRVIESYLSLERLRLGPRMRVSANLDDDALVCEIPPFILQPVVENAVRHGVSPSPAGGSVVVSASVSDHDDQLVIVVADDGVGCDAGAALTSNGLGLRSVRERLAARYGNSASVRVEAGVGAGTRVTIRLPAVAHSPSAIPERAAV